MNARALLAHLEKVECFEAIVDHGSFRAAARQLRQTQPALSRMVAILEHAIGVRLLERSRKGVVPTPEGLVVAAFATMLRKSAVDVAERITSIAAQGAPVGTVRCVCYEGIAAYLWPQVLHAAAQLAPSLELILETCPSAREMLRLLGLGEFDVALGVELPLHRGVRRTVLYSDDYGLFANYGGTLSSIKSISHLPMKTLLFVPDSICGAGQTVGDVLAERGYRSSTKYALSSYEALASMAVSGLGIAVLPRRPFRRHVEAGLLSEQLINSSPAAIGDYQVVCAVSRDALTKVRVAFLQETILPYALGKKT